MLPKKNNEQRVVDAQKNTTTIIVQKSASESFNPITKRWERVCKCGRICSHTTKKGRNKAIRKDKNCWYCVPRPSKKKPYIEYKRICKCGKITIYSNKWKWQRAENRHSKCIKCTAKRGKDHYKFDSNIEHPISLVRNCPECGIPKTYSRLYKVVKANRNNSLCPSCRIKGERNHMFGKTWPEEERLRIKERATKHYHKCKMMPSFNIEACDIMFEKINESFGLNGKHGKNGGEIRIANKSIDFCDLHKKLIIEWDEPHHLTPSYTNKDLIRQNIILDETGRDWVMIRWNERKNDWRTDLEHIPSHRSQEIEVIKHQIKALL